MRTMISGLSGWLKMKPAENESIRTVDMALTVVATLMAAVTWVMLHG